jgi:vacuolar-type H+-ATPase subunit D/Vma8
MTATDQAPTRAAILALREERVVVGEAYDFLDEKRLLLAAELLRQLEVYARLSARIEALAQSAGRRLAAAVGTESAVVDWLRAAVIRAVPARLIEAAMARQ